MVEISPVLECNRTLFTQHALQRMFERSITVAQALDLVSRALEIAAYPDDQPYPSSLRLAFLAEQPYHLVVARDVATAICFIITIYAPDPALWAPDFKTKGNLP